MSCFCTADYVISLPIAKHPQVLSPFLWCFRQGGLIVVCYRTIDYSLVKTRFRDEECSKIVCRSHQVFKPFWILCRGNAALTYPVIIKTLVYCPDSMCVVTGEGSEQIVLVINTLLEDEPVLKKEHTPIGPKDYAHKGEITTLQRIVVIVFHP